MTEFQPLLRLVQRWWWLMLLPMLVVLIIYIASQLNAPLGALPPVFTTQFKYTAAQIESNLTPRDGDYQDVWLASELTVNAFTEWIRSSTFRAELQTLVPDLNLGMLGISTDNARSIGQVFLSYATRNDLQRISEAAVTVLQTRSQAYFPHLGEQPAQVTLVDGGSIVPAPPPLVNRFEIVIRLGLALIVGIGLALLAELLDQRVRYADDVERLGLPIVGRIPRQK